MFDVKAVEADAKKELAEDAAKVAKTKIKDSLRKIEAARKIVANLEAEHAVLMADIGNA